MYRFIKKGGVRRETVGILGISVTFLVGGISFFDNIIIRISLIAVGTIICSIMIIRDFKICVFASYIYKALRPIVILRKKLGQFLVLKLEKEMANKFESRADRGEIEWVTGSELSAIKDKSPIRIAREKQRLTESELARLLGVYPHQIKKWEVVNYKPRKNTLERVCKRIDVNIDDVR